MNIEFDNIYVIQSLDPTEDTLTGQQLFDDILKLFSIKYPEKNAKLFNVLNSEELLSVLDEIKTDCDSGFKPIIHFEVHGLESRKGLALVEDDIEWQDLYGHLSEINKASKFHLFITSAVCYGNYAMILINPRHPAPFTGILGSFNELYEGDLYVAYTEFYSELLYSLDFDKALKALIKSNPGLPDDYKYLDSEQVFKTVYQKYFDKQFTPDKIHERFNTAIKTKGIESLDRDKLHNFRVEFESLLNRTKKDFFEKDKSKFFMFDVIPENIDKYCIAWEPVY